MSTKHTPGPWVIETYHGSLFKICKPDFKIGDEVAPRLEADARLIAAAPELLDALISAEMEIVEYLETLPKPHDCEKTLIAIRGAIAKATGGA